MRLHLGGQGLRTGSGMAPGLSEEARLDLDDPSGSGGQGGTATGTRRPVRGNALGRRSPLDRSALHHYRTVRLERVRQRAAHAALAILPLDRIWRAAVHGRAGDDEEPRLGELADLAG